MKQYVPSSKVKKKDKTDINKNSFTFFCIIEIYLVQYNDRQKNPHLPYYTPTE